MKHTLIILVLVHISSTTAFFFGGGGGGCGCAPPPACPPPPQQQPCAQRAVARGAKTMAFDQPIRSQPVQPAVYSVPDDLDLRAAAFGVPIVPQQQFSMFDILHSLGDNKESTQNYVVADGDTNSDYFPKENDEDLTVSESTGGLSRGKDIRRSPTGPTVHVHRDQDDEATTIASEIEKPADTFDNTKCSSQVLHKLMIDNISNSSAESKKNINVAAETQFGGNVDVICSRGHFSYIFTSNLYCEATKGLTTCIAFRQSGKLRR